MADALSSDARKKRKVGEGQKKSKMISLSTSLYYVTLEKSGPPVRQRDWDYETEQSFGIYSTKESAINGAKQALDTYSSWGENWREHDEVKLNAFKDPPSTGLLFIDADEYTKIAIREIQLCSIGQPMSKPAPAGVNPRCGIVDDDEEDDEKDDDEEDEDDNANLDVSETVGDVSANEDSNDEDVCPKKIATKTKASSSSESSSEEDEAPKKPTAPKVSSKIKAEMAVNPQAKPTVEWEWDGGEDGSVFQSYPPDICIKIEKAYAKKSKTVSFLYRGKELCINFGDMVQTHKENKFRKKTIRRVSTE